MELSNLQIDAIKEIINIGVGNAASILNTMLHSKIQLTVPYIKVILYNELLKEFEALGKENLSAVHITFNGHFTGEAKLIFPMESASKLINAFTEENNISDLDAIRSATLTEIGNIVLNAVVGTISNLLGLRFDFTVPQYTEGSPASFVNIRKVGEKIVIVLARAKFTVENLSIEGDIVLIFEVESFNIFLSVINEFITKNGD